MPVVHPFGILYVGPDFEAQVAVAQEPHPVLAALLEGGQKETGVHDLAPDDLVLQDAKELVAEPLDEIRQLFAKIAVCRRLEPRKKAPKVGNVKLDVPTHSALCAVVR